MKFRIYGMTHEHNFLRDFNRNIPLIDRSPLSLNRITRIFWRQNLKVRAWHWVLLPRNYLDPVFLQKISESGTSENCIYKIFSFCLLDVRSHKDTTPIVNLIIRWFLSRIMKFLFAKFAHLPLRWITVLNTSRLFRDFEITKHV